MKHQTFESLIDNVDTNSVFVEIGNERFEGSTVDLSDLALKHKVKLLCVDIDDNVYTNFQNKLSYQRYVRAWKEFYQQVQQPDWPKDSGIGIQSLPENIQQVVSAQWDQVNTEVQKVIQVELETKKSTIEWINQSGSLWSSQYGETCGAPISLLYLDNFDYNYNVDCTPEFVLQQIELYKNKFNLEMTNQNCQVEHLSQLINLYPYLCENCLVGFDDTFQSNGCWVGKNGPGVLYLLTKQWHIVHQDKRFLIMCKNPKVGL